MEIGPYPWKAQTISPLPKKPGTVTIAGRISKDLAPKTWSEYSQTSRNRPRRIAVKYAILIERTDNGYSAHRARFYPVALLPQIQKTEVEELIREAIILHLESLYEHGDPIPELYTTAALIEV